MPSDSRMDKYGLKWPRTANPASIEIDMLRHGGRWKKKDGTMAGEGMLYHWTEAIKHLWPHIIHHKWTQLFFEKYLEYRTIGVVGPASSGKTCSAALCALLDYYIFPSHTTVICCSTTKERLEDRIWGEIKKLHRIAKQQNSWLDGHLIEGRLRIVTDKKSASEEGRDFKSGLLGVPCKKGESYVGLSDFAGIKNKRVRLFGDECFPDGTRVNTPSGLVPIENVKPGDLVYSAIGIMPVLATSQRQSSDLLKINLRDGREVVCTMNHLFLTDSGWKEACELNESCFILSHYETMLCLRQDSKRNWEHQVLPGMPKAGERVHFLRKIIQAEIQKFDPKDLQSFLQCPLHALSAPGKSSEKDVYLQEKISGIESGFHQENGRETPWPPVVHRKSTGTFQDDEGARHKADGSGREWERPNETGIGTAQNVSIRNMELWGQDREMERERISPGLQSGHRFSRDKAGHRSRWIYPQQPIPQSEGRKERRISCGAWVESVEIYESEDSLGSKGGSGIHTVYNLHVAGHPSYSVEGLIVHNCSLLPRVFVDSIANLDKNPDFKAVALGNPKDTTDALGIFCEPAAHLGGWDGGIDQTPETKSWETRRSQGVCIQFPGPDSPNLDGKLNAPLITQEQIDRDISFYGKDSEWFSMMDMGMMPRGHGSRRVLTRQACLKFGAMEDPIWKDNNRMRIGFLDAAYRGVGGDRCIFGELQVGEEVAALEDPATMTNLISQQPVSPPGRKILHLVETMIVPIKQGLDELPEDQIVTFVKSQCEQRGITPSNFFFDSGMRTSLVSAFARQWSNEVNPIDCGGSATERKVSHDITVLCKDYYSKFITEMWWAVRLTVEARQFRGMTEDVMMEFAAREWTTVGANKIEVEPKAKMKEKTGRSPDLADAVAVGIEGARRRGFVIMRLKNESASAKTDTWKRELRNKVIELRKSKELNYAA